MGLEIARRVLVVEDEWLLAESMAAMLRSHGFVVVGPAANVKASLSLIESNDVDLAVLDVTLQNENSFPIAEELDRRGVPFLFVSGYTERDLPAKFAVRPLLTKPLEERALSVMLAAVITKPRPVQEHSQEPGAAG